MPASPQRRSVPFFSRTPVFTRAEYATAVGRVPGDPVVSAMLAQHLGAGNIRRIARGVFASVPSYGDPASWPVDPFQGASRLRKDGVIAYHAALELHGTAYTVGGMMQVMSFGQPRVIRTPLFSCRFVRPPGGRLPEDAVETRPRRGLSLRVTTLERTLADSFDRYDLAGGYDELFSSLDLVWALNAPALVRHALSLGNAAAIGALGFWLERERGQFQVSASELDALRAATPKRPRYALGARPGTGRLAHGWNVILPEQVVKPGWGNL